MRSTARTPAKKAVIASGFSRAKPMEEAQQLAAGPFIRKPHGPQRLGSAVRRELERAMDS